MMNKSLLILLLGIILIACDKDDMGINLSEQNFLVFGHFYGECAGEWCVETFKLTDAKLFEDTIDDYSGQSFDFVELDNALYEEVKDLEDFFPSELLDSNESVFGCPDCADGGGLFIQYSENGNVKSWRIDQAKNNVPDYLHSFMDEVNAKIELIND